MPTYGYRCTVCAHEFERFQKITDPPVRECESCNEPVKRILYPAGIQFKGSGFYITDYVAKGNEGGSSNPSEGAGSASSSGSESKESKSDSSGTATKVETGKAEAASSAK